MAAGSAPRDSNAVSIVTCTNRRACMDTLLRNYGRQRYPHKELIVILNGRNQAIDEYIQAASAYRNVRIYALPEHATLGRCLNVGVRLSRHPLIAKFDDDDYYGPDYLADSVRTLTTTGADIVGKRAHYMYLTGKKLLLHRYYTKANRYVSLIQGATLLVKRHVFGRVGFPDRNRGECVRFCSDCRALGFKIYAGTPRHFIAMRRSGSKDHTWIVSDRSLLTKNVKVLKVKNIRKYACGS